MTPRTTEIEAIDGDGVVGPAPRTRTEWPHELRLEESVSEIASRAAKHQLVGVGRIVELSLYEVGKVGRFCGDLGHDALCHLITEPSLFGVVGTDWEVEAKAAGRVLAGWGQTGVPQRRDLEIERGGFGDKASHAGFKVALHLLCRAKKCDVVAKIGLV